MSELPTQKSQSDKFKEAARELEADEDEKRWEERRKKIAKAKPGK
jgi:flagellar motility protein MotE (MotC chaperone)